MNRSAWDFKAILEALREQRWTVSGTAAGRHKCIPPNPDADIVVIAETSSWTAQHNTLRDLRRSGFVWPPTRPAPPAHSTTVPQIQADSGGGGHISSQAPSESVDERAERLWRELKEARGYLELVDEHLDELAGRIDEAARAWSEAQVERGSAAARLAASKAAFDREFEGVK